MMFKNHLVAVFEVSKHLGSSDLTFFFAKGWLEMIISNWKFWNFEILKKSPSPLSARPPCLLPLFPPSSLTINHIDCAPTSLTFSLAPPLQRHLNSLYCHMIITAGAAACVELKQRAVGLKVGVCEVCRLKLTEELWEVQCIQMPGVVGVWAEL